MTQTATERILGVAQITHKNGTIENIEYMAHGASPIGWTFQVSDVGMVVIHPSSVTKIEITRYKLDISRNGLLK